MINICSVNRSSATVFSAVFILLATLWFSGCVELGRMAPRLAADNIPFEVEAEAVSNCLFLDALIEEIDPGCLSMTAERVRCELDIRRRARQMGATHIVWIYRYPIGVAAKAYRCPAAPSP